MRWRMMTACLTAFVLNVSSASVAQIAARGEAAISQQDADRSAGALLDRWFSDFDGGALEPARGSGRAFPAYAQWLELVTSAMANGMAPSRLVSADPLQPPAGDAGKLVAAAKAAESELGDLLPALPGGKDLEKIAAFKQRTRPTSLTRVLLMAFQQEAPAVRASAAKQVLARYALAR